MSAANPMSPQASHTESSAEARGAEPSMEEILASIRRIIADDQSLPTHDPRREAPTPDVVREVSLHLLRPTPEPIPAAPQHVPVNVAEEVSHAMSPAEKPSDEPMRAYGEVSAPQFASPAGPIEGFEPAGFRSHHAAPEPVEREPVVPGLFAAERRGAAFQEPEMHEPETHEPERHEPFEPAMTELRMTGHGSFEHDAPEPGSFTPRVSMTDPLTHSQTFSSDDAADDHAAWHRDASEPEMGDAHGAALERADVVDGRARAMPDHRPIHEDEEISASAYGDLVAGDHTGDHDGESSTSAPLFEEPTPAATASTEMPADHASPPAASEASARRGERDMPSLFSAETDHTVASAFNMLAATRLADNSEELLTIARDMIRPLLRNWIDENLPSMVERMVRAEIERVARGGR